ncbi:unnamed protein product [Didymodactylos carnosus]|uniref:Uncharacterized protein n=1 Tax=Didymodactylos carnosus TaxID=1234261 RepID=A0A816AF28_9BILA|nr:unnamed protein product [Didymodactylos carnosus]CAF4468851.1 unnamed protein product [Didymodactylos carnosus]
MYGIIRYNNDHDIFIKTQLDKSLLTSISSAIIDMINKFHNMLFKNTLDDVKINDWLSKHQEFRQLLNLSSNQNLAFTKVLEKLYELQTSDDNFGFLKNLLELSFLYFVYSFYDLQSREFHLKLSSSPSIAITTMASSSINLHQNSPPILCSLVSSSQTTSDSN